MVIVFIIDSYGDFSNGTTVTAKRSMERLKELGHEVRIVSVSNNDGVGYYKLEKRKIPIVSYFAKKQNMFFAKPNKEVLKEAFSGADIIHLFLPYKASLKAIKIAKKMNIPTSTAFHMQPEHITYGMGLDRFGKPLSWFIYKWLKWRFYRKVTHIHCPSEFIRDKLIKHKYKNVFHVISNGVLENFFTKPNRESNPKIFKILSIGRYSKEKRQDTLLKAVSKSKFKDQIEITLAGKGPKEIRLKRLAKKLNLKVKFDFFNQQDLINEIANSHLYVHAAEAEIEGISALEAISSGLVPIVAKSKQSATAKFTLTEESRFKVRDVYELKSKIEFFINNCNRRLELEKDYRNYLKNYHIDNSIVLLEEMFKETIFDYKRAEALKSKKGHKIKKRITKTRKGRAFSFLFYYSFAMPLLLIYFMIFRGLRIKGRKNLKNIKGGAVFISNHVHKLDSVMGGITMFPKKPIFTSIPENFKAPIYGPIVNALGASPIPITPLEVKVFMHQLKVKLINGRYVHFFPEGELITKSENVREFKRGAFMLAAEAKVPIVPIKVNFAPKKGLLTYPFFLKDKIYISVGEPIYPNIFLSKRESIANLQEEAFKAMNYLN